MKLLFLLFPLLLMLSCSNNGSGSTEKDTANTDTNEEVNRAGWPRDKENELLDGCIESLKGKMAEDTAYTYCNCVLKQLRQDFPDIDSASSVLQDSTKAAKYVANCQ